MSKGQAFMMGVGGFMAAGVVVLVIALLISSGYYNGWDAAMQACR